MSRNDEAPADDPLRAFLSGKRRSERHPVLFRVALSGGGQAVHGRTVDVSAGGVLIRVPDEEVGASGPPPPLLDLLGLVEKHLQGEIEIAFPEISVRVPGTLVRMTVPPGEGGYFLLGCRFARPLAPAERERLLPAETAAARGPLALAPRPGATVQALVFVERPDLAGPLAGLVVGVESGRFDVRFDSAAASTAGAAESLLGDRTARVRLLEGGALLWEGAARILHARPVTAPARGVDVRFEAGSPLPKAAASRFRKR